MLLAIKRALEEWWYFFEGFPTVWLYSVIKKTTISVCSTGQSKTSPLIHFILSLILSLLTTMFQQHLDRWVLLIFRPIRQRVLPYEPELIIPTAWILAVTSITKTPSPSKKTLLPPNLRTKIFHWAHSSRLAGHLFVLSLLVAKNEKGH